MRNEDATTDFAEPDDLEENTCTEQRRAGTLWGKVFMWSCGTGCVLYYGAKLSHWLIGFPASLKEIEGWIFIPVFTMVGISLISGIDSSISATIKEFRIRSRRIDHRLTEIQAQIESMTERANR